MERLWGVAEKSEGFSCGFGVVGVGGAGDSGGQQAGQGRQQMVWMAVLGCGQGRMQMCAADKTG